MMGRRFLGAFLVGLALLTQALVPVAASRMVTHAVDPFDHLPICSTDVGTATDPSNSGPSLPHHDHCQLCQIVMGGWLPPDGRAFTAATLSAEPEFIRWRAPGVQHVVFGADQHRPPRGPPLFS